MASTGLAEGILRTKIQVPRSRTNRVLRTRLFDRLSEGADYKLTLVCAPAGFGKTSLVAQWIEACQSKPSPISNESQVTKSLFPSKYAWLVVDEADNTLERFFRYLLASLERILPGSGESTRKILEAPKALEPRVLATSLINSLEDNREPLTLIIDDFHNIQAAPINEAVEFILEHMPESMRVIILSRADPNLPLARMRARSELLEIRGADLRFSPQETSEFFSQVMKLNLSAPQIKALESRTEGWITGLQLAGLSLQDRDRPEDFIEVFTGSHRYVLDYLIEEVLNRQPEDLQEFLVKTSILNRLSGPLCDALLGKTASVPVDKQNRKADPGSFSQPILELLERSNLFLSAVDDERQWFRYHTLFGDLLRYRLSRLYPSELSGLHQKVAMWFESHGLINEAVQHFFASGDTDKATAIIARDCERMLSQGQANMMLGWLENLPGRAFEYFPKLHLMATWGLITICQFSMASARLDTLETLLDGLTPEAVNGKGIDLVTLMSEIASTRAIIASTQGDFAKSVQLSRRALEGLKDDYSMRCSVLIGLAVSLRNLGESQEAGEVFSEAAQVATRSKQFAVAVGAHWNEGDIHLELGNLAQASEGYLAAIRVGKDAKIPLLSLAYGGLSEIALEQGQYPEALSFIQKAISYDEAYGNREIEGINQARLGRILILTGQEKAGLEIIEKICKEVEPLTPNGLMNIEYFQAATWNELGFFNRSLDYLNSKIDPKLPLGYLNELNFLMRAEAYLRLACGDADQETLSKAFQDLDAIIPGLREVGRKGRLIHALALYAWGLALKQRLHEAYPVLRESLELAFPEGYFHTFIRLGSQFKKLLEAFHQWDLSQPGDAYLAEYAGKIIKAFPTEETHQKAEHTKEREHSSAEQGLDALSNREVEVLRLVAAGLSNSDIATRLYLSPGTVKRHLHNIFEKLEANSRSQAIAQARRLKLI